MRLILAGSPAFATNVFMPLFDCEDFKIIGLICQPDKPFGRKGELKPPHTKQSLAHTGVPIFQPTRIDDAFIAQISALKPHAIVVVAYGVILPQAFLDIAPCINLHASILPHWRGASPMQQMIVHNDKYFGITAIKMTQRLDSGEILALSYMANTGQNISELGARLSARGAKLIQYVLTHLDDIEPLAQSDADASYCAKIKKSDGCVRLDSAKDVYSAYLAYYEWPHIFIQSPNGYTLKFFDTTLIESTQSHKAGEILAIESQDIIIGCARGSLRIKTLQQEGKNKLHAALYVRGKRLNVGDVLC